MSSSNRIFSAYKGRGISSRDFLNRVIAQHGGKGAIRKAGYFGTLDPFAHGTLIIAFGSYTKLFALMEKNVQKRYVATLMLDSKSSTLDSEGLESIIGARGTKIQLYEINSALDSIIGTLRYRPPAFSAKRINGERAYSLARKNTNFELEELNMSVYECKLLSYTHPFLRFEVLVSGGAYVRSLGEIIAKKLRTSGTLCSLERTEELLPLKVQAKFNQESRLDPLKILNLKTLNLSEFTASFSPEWKRQALDESELERALLDGKKVSLKKPSDSRICVKMTKHFCVLDLRDDGYSYVLNAMELD